MVISCSMRTARSGGFIGVIAAAVLIETSVLHVVLVSKHPALAWTLTVSSLWALGWIILDHRALGRTTIRVTSEQIEGEVGRRLVFSAPRSAVASVEPPRLMPVSGPPKGYINATKPASPNVLIVFRAPVTMRLFGVPRPVRQLALHLDAPESLKAALTPAAGVVH